MFRSSGSRSTGARARARMSLRICGFLLPPRVACVRLLARGELDVVHAHNIPDFLVFAGLVPRLAGRKVVLDVHDSVPETFAAKFSEHVARSEGAVSRRTPERPDRAQGDLRQPSAARRAGRARHSRFEDVHLDECPGPANLQARRPSTARTTRTGDASISSTTERWPIGWASIS